MTDNSERKQAFAVFRMPSVQNVISRKSSITNAFVNSVIPTIPPSAEDILEALAHLDMTVYDVRCAYCGDSSTEWDHLRPLVVERRPTGFISEIANLVPACGKCNQSKGNKPWREWMLSNAPRSPSGRRVADVAARIERLARYELWRVPTRIEFEKVLREEMWNQYWALCERVIQEMQYAQEFANNIRRTIIASRIETPSGSVEKKP